MKIDRIDLSELSSALPEHIDLLLLSASFEDRCTAVASAIDPAHVVKTFVAQNRNHATFHSRQADLLMSRFASNAALLPLDSSDPLFTADALNSIFLDAFRSKARCVVVDITTFTRETVLLIYKIAYLIWANRDVVRYVYARAEEYAPSLPIEEKWLSKGIANIRSVLGYPGKFEPSRRLHLIVLVGFEYDRVAELIRRCEPSIISLGQHSVSGSPDSDAHMAGHKHNYAKLQSVFGEVDKFEFPGYDPDGTSEAVLAQFKKHPEHNCMVSPMNTKISAIGVAIAATHEPEMQIVYAQAMIYNTEAYSTAGSTLYLISQGA